jgi:hypothetical protein
MDFRHPAIIETAARKLYRLILMFASPVLVAVSPNRDRKRRFSQGRGLLYAADVADLRQAQVE